jgi:ABC-type nitrate/sulfonate/bicarbonate transport system permease component
MNFVICSGKRCIVKRRDAGVAALALLIVWQILAKIVSLPILPAPLQVLGVLVSELQYGLSTHFVYSLWRVFAGMALSVLAAVPVGLAIGGSKILDRFFSPLIYLLYPIPKVVFVPVVILFLGIGDTAKITIIFMILFFQIVVLVRDQAAGLPPQLIQSLRSVGAGRRALFRFVYLPASLPAILTALRQSIGTAVAVLYITELSATKYGLGYYIYYNGSTLLDYPAMYAGVIAMSLLGLGMYLTVDWLERRWCRWQFVS